MECFDQKQQKILSILIIYTLLENILLYILFSSMELFSFCKFKRMLIEDFMEVTFTDQTFKIFKKLFRNLFFYI